MYHKIKEGRIAYFDIDHTMIIWELEPKEIIPTQADIAYYNSLRRLSADKRMVKLLEDTPEYLLMRSPKTGKLFRTRPIWTHVLQLVQQRLKGLNVVVWSAGGSDWAECVVTNLGLEEFVDVIMTKPDFFYDDSTPDGFMGRHFFFAWDEINGKMKGKKQSHHDFRRVIKENLKDE